MEKIGCSKYGGMLEIAVAAEYYQEDGICQYCPHNVICKKEKEEADG